VIWADRKSVLQSTVLVVEPLAPWSALSDWRNVGWCRAFSRWYVRSVSAPCYIACWQHSANLSACRQTAYRHIITLASSLKYPKNSQRKRWKLPFSTIPLSFDAPSPGNLQEYSHTSFITPETRIIGLLFAADSMALSSFNFLWWTPKETSFLQQNAYRPSRSSKVVDFGTNRKGVCDFLLVINSNFGPMLHRLLTAYR